MQGLVKLSNPVFYSATQFEYTQTE